MRKTQILMKKSVYLGLSILDLSKSVMYEFWYDYSKMVKKQELDSFIVYVRKNDIYKNIR